jgi:hypothetical protein
MVTLVSVYFACWGPTQSRGLTDVENHVYWGGKSRRGHARVYGTNTSVSLPLVVGTDLWSKGRSFRGYYLWVFGIVLKLPFEIQIPDDVDHWGYVMEVGHSKKIDVTLRFGVPDEIVSDREWLYHDVGTFRFDNNGRITKLAE